MEVCLLPDSQIVKRMLRSKRRHVIQDLEPYICIRETCPCEQVLYSTSEDWLDHLRSIHDLRWVCSSNDHEEEYFQDEFEYHKHVTERHGIVANEKMLSLLSHANQAEAPEAFDQCPLCALSGDEHSSDKEKAKQFVLADLVAHLRQLAALSLVVDHAESAAGLSSVSSPNSIGRDIDITAATRSSQHSDSDTDHVNEALETNKTDFAFVPSEEIYDEPPDSEMLFSAAWLRDLGGPPRFRSDYKDGSPGISDTSANEPDLDTKAESDLDRLLLEEKGLYGHFGPRL